MNSREESIKKLPAILTCGDVSFFIDISGELKLRIKSANLIDTMESNELHVSPIALSDHPFSNKRSSDKNIVHHSSSDHLYQTIISLAHAWTMYYEANTPDSKNEAFTKIRLLEAERNRILGTLSN